MRKAIAVVATAGTLLAPAAAAADRPTKMTERQANRYVRSALVEEGYGEYEGYRRDCARRSRTRFVCRVGFFAGDTSFSGDVTVWHHTDGETWHYRGTLTLLNEYCVDVGNRNCSERVRIG